MFESLTGIAPGTSTVAQAVAALGTPTASEASEGALLLAFPAHGVDVFVDRADRAAADPVVDEVAITPRCALRLPCGVYLGQPRADAVAILRMSYQVTDEYDDAVYFRPCSRADLLAPVEFRDGPAVVRIELMRMPPHAARGG